MEGSTLGILKDLPVAFMIPYLEQQSYNQKYIKKPYAYFCL